MHRSKLKNAPYNPRVISDKAKRKLREIIKGIGLISAPTWNERTGNLVGGHQRIAALDALEGTADYTLTVERVSMSDDEEKAANVALNNNEAQGEFTIEGLEKIFKDSAVKLEHTGFDAADLYRMFGDSPFDNQTRKDDLDDLAKKLREARERYDETREQTGKRDQCDFYFVVVCKDDGDRADLLKSLGLDDNRWQCSTELRRVYQGVISSGKSHES